ncbi:hypothetical protein [Streptomyces sp. WAC06614]|uniref:hypothetical protein n=1 Tax=Streptomyces sp. WAC06614 TaxID=2487416 RepID=UPI000F7B832A|nr:hypothetical protein [Streptomyces sp. WAC06614]RSS80108.1 hypothetical protein EF918_14900 [Streptomyces sp. WAC06614]
MFMPRARSGRMAAVTATAMGVGLGLLGAAPSQAADTIAVRCAAESLQTAIDNAPADSTLKVSGHCVGPFTIDKNLTVVGVDSATLDGNHAGRTLTVTGPAVVKLSKVRIIGGRSTTGSGGGGILNAGATLTLTHCVVSENVSSSTGGGIRNEGTLTLDDTTVRHNTAATLGGGIDNVGASGRSLTVTDSRIHDNTATTINGGGLFNDGTASLTRTVVEHNSAVTGGGIRNTGSQGRLTLTKVKVRFNLASEQGGGLGVGVGATTRISDSKIHGNTAQGGPGSGGGIRNDGAVTLTRTTVVDNHPENCAPDIAGCVNTPLAATGAAKSSPHTPARPDGERV